MIVAHFVGNIMKVDEVYSLLIPTFYTLDMSRGFEAPSGNNIVDACFAVVSWHSVESSLPFLGAIVKGV